MFSGSSLSVHFYSSLSLPWPSFYTSLSECSLGALSMCSECASLILVSATWEGGKILLWQGIGVLFHSQALTDGSLLVSSNRSSLHHPQQQSICITPTLSKTDKCNNKANKSDKQTNNFYKQTCTTNKETNTNMRNLRKPENIWNCGKTEETRKNV